MKRMTGAAAVKKEFSGVAGEARVVHPGGL